MRRERPQARILVVDDEPANVQILGKLLDEAGYDVVPALSGAQALARAAAARPDLVLLDMFMPGMDGREVSRRLREVPECADLPVVFLTVAREPEYLVEAFKLGAVDYLNKPFVSEELLARVKTHVDLKLVRDHLNSMLDECDQLLDIVTHDLKHPLANIHFAALMLGKVSDEQYRSELVQDIVSCSDEALQFIKRYLAGREQGERMRNFLAQPFDLHKVAKSVLQSQRATAESASVSLSLSGAAHPVTADPMAVRNVLHNLVSNAVRHSPPGKEVTVEVGASRSGYVQCSVKDLGPGIAETERDKLFQRFVRLRMGASRDQSTGLGLSIAKHDVTRMGGHLWYEPRSGGGSIFAFELPESGAAVQP